MVVAQLGEIGPHTRYMVARGFTRSRLPSYKYHKMEKKVRRGPMDNFFGRAAVRVEGANVSEDGDRRGGKEEEEEEEEMEEGRGDNSSDGGSYGGSYGGSDGGSDGEADGEDDGEGDRASELTESEEDEDESKREEKEEGSRLAESEVVKIAYKLAEVLESKRAEKEMKDMDQRKIEENWTFGETMLVCRPCMVYSKGPDVPALFRNGASRGSGTVQRKSKNGKERTRWRLNETCARHEKTNLHIWCESKEKKEMKVRRTFDERNEEAGKLVVRTGIKTLKRGGGAKDFMADLDLLSLTPGVVYAVKNNSEAMWFDIRESTYEVVSTMMKNFFRENVRDIAVSLDKVTVHHTSYTVIVTYFFCEGKLHMVMNQLTILKLDDYDAEGTARMVVDSLTATLGFTRTELANRLRHFSYDGVYASKEERVAGGGCLSLVENVTEVLGLDKEAITGIWDTGHNLQVIWIFTSYQFFPL